MNAKPRLGRKDIFTDSQVNRKEDSKRTVKPEKKKNIKTDNHLTRFPENQNKIKVTFQITENLFIQIKIKAAKERKKISDLVGEMLSQYLIKEKEG